jgi:transposase-like protein
VDVIIERWQALSGKKATLRGQWPKLRGNRLGAWIEKGRPTMNTSNADTEKKDHLGKGPKQTRRDRAILALLQHGTVEKAAAAVNLHPSTLYRWWKEPDFRDQFLEARSRAFALSLSRLQQAAPVAASMLPQVMAHQDTPPGSVIRACDSILSHAERGFELDVLEARFSKLEKRHSEEQDKSAS